ncbi:MAG: precorrin-2 C(20)-methyltransferase [Proteobacteria bacterium]|nr:precorrin-2 C(20)-methyltransferase [Pseudomonadota bacterium]MDA1323396.1 precorrin-2 C(20)-methyltransferase [Pseudomonadota bacterium]
MSAPGRIWGVGVGPGDPELLTLKAHRIITTADTIAYPAPNEGDSLARSIVAEFLPGGQEEIVIRISMDPKMFPPEDVYAKAAEQIGAHAAAGKSVAILCEGDPFFFGSFMYLFEKLSDRWDMEIVPGVSSMMASAAALQIPLAARNDVISVIPATLDEDAIAARLATADTAVFIKVGRHLAKVRKVLEAAGLVQHAHYIERATMTAERKMPLAHMRDTNAPYFSMVLVHRRGSAL